MNSRRLIAAPKLQERSIVTCRSNRLKGGRQRKAMSALGQKQTCALQKPMSALPRKRTSERPRGMLAKGGAYSITSSARAINIGDKLIPSAFAVFKLTTCDSLARGRNHELRERTGHASVPHKRRIRAAI